jgi:hypothetical protein
VGDTSRRRRRHRIAVRLLTFLPSIVLHAPERVALKVACVIIGVISLWRPPPAGSIAAISPRHIVVEWSIGFIVGGVLTLVGMYLRRGVIERAGLAFFAFGSVWFAAAAIVWGRGFAVAVIFSMIAAASLIRLVLSSVVRKTARISMEAQERDLDRKLAEDD